MANNYKNMINKTVHEKCKKCWYFTKNENLGAYLLQSARHQTLKIVLILPIIKTKSCVNFYYLIFRVILNCFEVFLVDTILR